MTPLGAEIKATLFVNGMTYKKLGSKIGYNHTYISNAVTGYEQHRFDNSHEVLKAIVDHLHIDLEKVTPEPRMCMCSRELYHELNRQKAMRELTVNDIAVMTGCSSVTVSRVLNEHLGINTAIKIADALGIPHGQITR